MSLRNAFESLVRKAFRACGLDLTRLRPEEDDKARVVSMLRRHGIDMVLDVGANKGQFGRGLREHGFRGYIVSFEPLGAAHMALEEASRGDARWYVAPRMAIGAESGEIWINVAGNSVSSSILPMLERHSAAAPTSSYVGIEPVPMMTLDDAARPYLDGFGAVFVKIDTQGYESAVLDGAGAILAMARGVQLELSSTPLYQGQELIHSLLERLYSIGFSLWMVSPAFTDPATRRQLQVDATLFREPQEWNQT